MTACAALALVAGADPVRVRVVATADRENCQYATSEKATATFLLRGADGVTLKQGLVKVTVDNYGARELLPARTVDLAKENPIRVTVGRETPGFARVRLEAEDKKALRLEGIKFDPKIRNIAIPKFEAL